MSKVTNYQGKSFEEVYKNMCDLKKDLYYKDIVNAHKDVIERHISGEAEDIIHQYKKRYIDKTELFTLLEGLYKKNKIVDSKVFEYISYCKKTFCRPRKKPNNFNSKDKSSR